MLNATMEESKARTVVMLPEPYRQAVRTLAEERGVEMGVILAELIEGNDELMAIVKRIRKRREEDKRSK